MSDTIKVESGIPLTVVNTSGSPAKYPWRNMAVGDSFFVKDDTLLSIRRLSSAANQQAKRHGGKYACRRVDGGVRVWRVE